MQDPSPSPAAVAKAGRSFSKKAPDVRRQELIEATVRCLCRDGAEQLSVRAIAAEAGLSLGMVRHHFKTKDELLAATLAYLSAQNQEQVAPVLAAPGLAPLERLHAFIRAALQSLDKDYVRARFLFWGLAHTNPAVRRVHDEIYRRFERQVGELVAAVAREKGTPLDVQVTTLAILALLKGIWVEWSLTPDRTDALRLAEQILPALDRSFGAPGGSL